MTTPLGAPNLPVEAMTLADMASRLQDMSGTAMHNRAVERFPNIFNTSTGLNPAVELTPFGILTRIWAEINSVIANADPADVQGPDDIPPLLINYIEGLPMVGQWVTLMEAFLGTYSGDDPTLLDLQSWAALLPLLSGGLLSPGVIPGLDASKIVSGIFGTGLIPGLDASKITSGVFGTGLIPGLDVSKITSGVFGAGFIPGLDASKITSGTFGAAPLQPLIDAVGQGFGGSSGLGFSGLQSYLAGIPGAQQVLDTLVSTFLGLGGSGYGTTDLIHAIESIPTSFLSGTLAPGQASHLGAGILSDVIPEFLTNPNFDTANSLIGLGDWTWDGTQGPDVQTTSVYTDADGSTKELFSNGIPVAAGQVLNISGFTKWSSFTGAADSIKLTVAQYDATNTLLSSEPYHTIDSIASPGTSGGWTQLQDPMYTVPADVTKIFVRPEVTSGATAGRVRFGGMSATPTSNQVSQSLVPGIQGVLDLGTSLQATVDQLASAYNPAGSLSGATFAQLADLAQETVANALAAFGLGQDNTNILNFRNNRPGMFGLQSTVESNIPFANINRGGAVPTNVVASPTNAPMSLMRVQGADSKGFFQWLGVNGATAPTDYRINIYKMDQATGDMVFHHQSPDLHTSLSPSGTTPIPWNTYTFSGANQMPVVAGDVIGGEHLVTGSGATHNIAGDTGWAAQHPTSKMKALAASRNPAAAALAIQGTANSSATTTVTIPTHAVGDVIVIAAASNTSSTLPTKPAASGTVPAWADIDANAGANSCSLRTVQFVATATNHTSGTWTGATAMIAIVLRNQAATPIGGHTETGGTATGSATAPAATISTNGTSVLLHLHVTASSQGMTAWNAAPTGYTRQATQSGGSANIALNSKNTTTTDGAIAQTSNGASNGGYRGATIEIRSLTLGPTPSTIPASDIAWSNTIPHGGFGISTVPANYQPDEPVQYSTAGSSTYPIPSWIKDGDTIDVVVLGGGKGGSSSFGWLPGTGGNPGAYSTQTLTCGTDFPDTATTMSYTVGVGGASNSGNGGASSVTWTDPASTPHTLTGAAGTTLAGGNSGVGPGNHDFNGHTYFGGSDVGSSADGSPPGGGGGGGFPWLAGGAGAAGSVWFRAKQTI